MNKYQVLFNAERSVKKFDAIDYKYTFNLKTGFFARWGKDLDDDPLYSPYGPEIFDCEITTSCTGACKFCYKANTPNGKNMSFETFKIIFDKLPPTLTQIAFGADANAKSNPDLWKMMWYCLQNNIIPNITVADIDDETAEKLLTYCGAVAVSRYADKNKCYDSVQKLTDLGMEQINIHQLVCEETYDQILETFKDIHIDYRLSKLNAIVLLSLKTKGRAEHGYTQLSQEKFTSLVQYALENNISIGFDSCGADKFFNSIKDTDHQKKFEKFIEPCESTLFSMYCDVEGKFYPCSFSEQTEGWKEGIDLTKINDFMSEVWYNNKVIDFRNHLLKGGRKCPIYQI